MEFIKTRAAVAWAPNEPLKIEELDLMPPQKGEVLVRIVATGVCHTDAYTLSGQDSCKRAAVLSCFCKTFVTLA